LPGEAPSGPISGHSPMAAPGRSAVRSGGAANAYLGNSVAVDGVRVVVGAASDDTLGPSAGAAYVFGPEGEANRLGTRLTAPGVSALDRFGTSVAASGDRIVVGAPKDDGHDTDSGTAFVFETDADGGWIHTVLSASDGSTGDRFGESVAVSGGRIVVGAPTDDNGGRASGSAYVFEPDGTGGWTETKLTASDARPDNRFGWAVAVDGDRIVIGAQLANAGAADTGAVYVYEADGSGGWAETKLIASDAEADDRLGWSVAVSGDRVVAVSPRADGAGPDTGAAYVFEPDGSGGWTETILTPSDADADDRFGWSVAADGDRIVVGAPWADGGLADVGAVYVFDARPGGWTQTRLFASDGAAGDQFGRSVAVSGTRIVAGAEQADPAGQSSGAAYVYTVAPR